jgi:membrane protease YdiL (CAAX protease family)
MALLGNGDSRHVGSVEGTSISEVGGVSGRALAAFFAIAFLGSWTCWLMSAQVGGAVADVLAIAGRFGPAIGAVVAVVFVDDGSLSSFLRQRARSRGPWWYWFVVLAAPPLVVLVSLLLAASFGEQLGDFNDLSTLYLIVPAFVVVFVLGGPLGEEVGWRGVALDPLQERMGPIAASVVLGIVWGLWHIPLFFDPAQIQHDLSPLVYLGQTTATAFVYTWFWNRSRSLPLVMALHASINVSAGAFPLLMPEANSQVPFALAVVLASVIAVGLVLVTGGTLGLGDLSSKSAVDGRGSIGPVEPASRRNTMGPEPKNDEPTDTNC